MTNWKSYRATNLYESARLIENKMDTESMLDKVIAILVWVTLAVYIGVKT